MNSTVPSDEDRTREPSSRRSKRLKTNSGRERISTKPSTPPSGTSHISLSPLLETARLEEIDFESIIEKEEYLAARERILQDSSETDAYGYKIRPLTISEVHGLRGWLDGKSVAAAQSWTNGDAILIRRLKLQKIKHDNAVFSYDALRRNAPQSQTLSPTNLPPSHPPPDEETLAALHSIRKTPLECSFASRLVGPSQRYEQPYLIHRDWETQTPWMDLLSDIRLHYSLSHPQCNPPDETIASIDYVSLQRRHLSQVHDLLSRVFWPGIDVSDSLQYTPTQCTIVATYKYLVVGAALLSSPDETYLTYLVVRPGWEHANIASIMLYHLITANPRKDITLHVSANNPATLLYNKFGFKAEEFIVGFYEDYLAKESRACKNAFRLRLRR